MILIKGGLLIDPANNRMGAFDVLCEGTLIKEVAERGRISVPKEAQVVDVAGGWVVPGLVDMHVHLREPGFEWKETIKSGAQAAALGGFAAVCCMANTQPVNDCAEITRFILAKGAEAGGAAVYPLGAVTRGLKGKELAPFLELRQAGCVAFSDDGRGITDALIMRRALEWCRMLDVPLCCHEEDESLTQGGSMNESELSLKLGLRGLPAMAEEAMIARDIELARATCGRVHFCHVSTARSVELIRRAKQDGLKVTAEVTPHHLLLTEDRVADYDTYAKMNPPLRKEKDCAALIAGLRDGTIDAIASDHAPHENDVKEIEFEKAAFGLIGLETSLPLMLNLVREEKLSSMRLIEAMSLGPARIMGLSGYGKLSKGEAANITVIHPQAEWIFDRLSNRSLSFNSPWLGEKMTGRALLVMVRGRIVVQEGKLVGNGVSD